VKGCTTTMVNGREYHFANLWHGTDVRRVYDAHGNVVAQIQRSGWPTKIVYTVLDASGTQIATARYVYEAIAEIKKHLGGAK